MSQIDEIYQRIQDDTEAMGKNEGKSEIAKHFEGLNVFVTGGSDLLGMCLLEKLLRSCPQLKNVYLLIKTKVGEDFEKECNKLFEDNVFDILRESNPHFKNKIKPLKGDLMMDKLGLNIEDYKTLTENINIIFHNGAMTKLNEKIIVALKTNVLGTQRMLDLAHDCRYLKAFVFVSSCYAYNHHKVIEDKFYNAPADLNMINDMIEAETQTGMTEETLKMLLGKWSNIYNFTKATAEEIVQNYARKSTFACCVFRPSTVISTYKEPMPGWCNSKNKPASFFIKIAVGAIHVLYEVNEPCDLVPADLCANALIVSTWDAIDRWQIEPEACVYNYGTSKIRPLSMNQIKEKMMDDSNAFLSSKITHSPSVILTTNFLLYFILRILFDYIPALISDIVAIVLGSAPKSWSLVRETTNDMCYLYHFVNGNWRVQATEIIKAYEKLNPRDRELFFCDLRRLNWDEYFLAFWRGIRLNVLKDSPNESDSERCHRCPCKCPCKCVGYGIVILLGLLTYYLISTLMA